MRPLADPPLLLSRIVKMFWMTGSFELFRCDLVRAEVRRAAVRRGVVLHRISPG